MTKFGFLRTALAVGVAIPVLAGAGAFAQAPAASPTDQSPLVGTGAGTVGAAQTGSQPAAIGGGEFGATAETERIIVTGSNIPTAQEVGANPVLNISRDLINKSGERTAEALIKNLPIANGGGVPISNNATGFTPGATAVSLRGLGPQATLLLIDGRRVAPYPIGSNGTSSFFDLRSIPEAGIDSIEVLKDGASTTYGADAVAGVVNIKLRHDYKGVQAQVAYGNTLDKDSGEIRANVVFGIGDGNTNVTGVIDYYHRNSLLNRDRGYSAVPIFLSTNSTPENLSLTYDQVVAAGGTPPPGFGPVGNPDGLPSIFFGHAPFGSNGLDPASDYTYTAARSSFFNYNRYSSSYPEIENYGGFAAFDHKWFGDQLVIYGDLYYQNAASHDELAASATGNFQSAGQVTLAIPPHSNLNGVAPPLTPTYEATLVPPDAFNPFNPFNQIISGGSRARILEFGNRLFDNTTDSFLVTLGARGDKLFDGTWGYDFGFRYSQVKATEHDTLVSTSRYNQILNQNDPVFQPGGALEGETAFNPFGDATAVTISSNAATTAFAIVHPNSVSTSELGTLDLNIYTTELFKLSAGGVGFAFGGQFRKEQLTQNFDQLFLNGDIIGTSPSALTQAGRKDWALYAEASAPFFSPTFNVPGAYALEFTAAIRYEAFKNNNTNVAVPKFGMRWQPFDETFTVRATWGEGFREPSLFELYASPTSGFSASTDILPTSLGGPATPVGDPSRFESETLVVITSSPVVQPEDSRSFSGGIVWTPKWVNGLTLSIDLWNIEQTGVVVSSTATQVLDNELAGAEGTGGFAPGQAVERNADGTISRIFLPFVNSGNTQTNGIDFGLQYVYPTKFGTFTWVTNATWVNTFQFATFADQPQKELNGYTTDPGASNDGYLKWKGVSRIDWAWNGWDLVLTANYLDGFHERYPNGLLHYTSQTWFFDGQLSYNFTFVPPVENQPVAGYSKDAKDVTMGKDGKATESPVTQTAAVALPLWKQALNDTQITLGCNDMFGADPPRAYGLGGNSTNYPGFLYDSTGRFVYVQLTKKF